MKKIFLILVIAILFMFSFCEDESGGNSIDEANSYVQPNPISPTSENVDESSATITISYNNPERASKLSVSCTIWTLHELEVFNISREISVEDSDLVSFQVGWGGKNNDGNIVSPGIYRASIKVKVLERYGDTSLIGGSVNTFDLTIVVE